MHVHITDVLWKNEVTDNSVKMELDMDQGSMKSFEQFHDKTYVLWAKFTQWSEYKIHFYFDDISLC